MMKNTTATTERELREVTKQIDRLVDAIASVGVSKALREKLVVLERQRDDFENSLRLAEVEPMALAPG